MNKIIVKGVIGRDVLAADFIARLNSLNGDVSIYVESAGGSFFQGIEMFNAMRNYKNGEITVIIGSLAASIASYFPMAADKVVAYDNSTMMLHAALVINFEGNAVQMRKTAQTLDGVTSLMIQAYVKKTGKKEDEISAILDAETYFFGAEMLAAGLVDEILANESEIAAVDAKAAAASNILECKTNCKADMSSEFDNMAALLDQNKQNNELLKEAQQILREVNNNDT